MTQDSFEYKCMPFGVITVIKGFSQTKVIHLQVPGLSMWAELS